MCRCRELRQRVEWLEKVIVDADWKLRYADFADLNEPSPFRRTQIIVASDLSRGLAGLPPYDYEAIRRAAQAAEGRGDGE